MARTDDRFRAAFNAFLDLAAPLAAGDSLPSEYALSQRLGVSRTVIRAVLRQGQDQGLLLWQGREKRLLRAPATQDRLAPPVAPRTETELERLFLDWVLRADVPPGTALNVADLSRRFAVTPHRLHAFLTALSRFGLVRRRSRGGWQLQGFTRDFALELSDFRLILERNAVQQVLALPPDHPLWPRLDALEAAHHDLAARIDTGFNDFPALDESLHAALGSVVRNRFIDEVQKIIALIFHYHYQWNKATERDRNRAAIAEHLRLIAALRARDGTAALAALDDHLRAARETLLASFRDPPPP